MKEMTAVDQCAGINRERTTLYLQNKVICGDLANRKG